MLFGPPFGAFKRTGESGALAVLRQEHGSPNGYVWEMFRGLKFMGHPCGIAVCFHFDRLTEIHFCVSLPGARLESGWPTREAIDQEVGFIRSALSDVFGVSFESGSHGFKWGEVWSMFDQKCFIASSGIRYAA